MLISCIVMGHERPLNSINVMIHVMFLWKTLFKRYNLLYVYREILHLLNFSNNKLLYIVILLLPLAWCFISVNECLIRKAKTWLILIFLTSKPSLLLLNLGKELKLIFSPHQVYDIWNSVIEKKKITQLYCHIIFFYRYVLNGKFW